MKKISIRAQLTFWYITLLMVFLYIGVVASYNAMFDIFTNQHKEGMQRGGQFLAEKIEKADNLEAFLKGEEEHKVPDELYFMYFDEQNHLLSGKNEEWMITLPQKINEFRVITHDDKYWAMYDKSLEKAGKQIGWIRTLINVTPSFDILLEMKRRGFISIIPSLLLCALGGFLITRWALKPIKKVAETAKEIGEGNLNKRIALPQTKDEIGQLLTEFNHMADQLQHVIDREKQFSADASHELRTPISVIIANAEYALDQKDPKIYEDSLKLIVEKGKHLTSMLSQLMMLAKESDQVAAMELETLNLSDIVKDIAEERRPKAEEKKITIHTKCEDSVMVQADLMLISRLITNLVDNAITYGKEDGEIHIETYFDTTQHKAILTVKDNGIGISADDLPLIFNRFYRADKSRTKSGSGLGLSFVDFIVKLHKGTISVDSEIGKGTEFVIHL